MTMRTLLVSCLVLLANCAGPLRQFYPDSYYEEDQIYENKPLKFLLQFRGNWELITDPNEFGKSIVPLAKQASKEGRELLFVGSTIEGRHVVTGMASNANEPARDYAEIVRRLNKYNVENDQGLTDMVVNRNSMVKWVYDKGSSRIVEFIFQINTYDIRIIFGTPRELFEKFLPVYEEIMTSLQVTR
ncbi:MAG: hypothetical protein MUF22_04675 [Chitinispirillaceae bacterium]|jgi:hypothetical protein|nr:hypothetical protein [Chitinispirillaceae bacterium]